MKCPKCGYTSFPHLESCGKCGQGLAKQRAFYGIYALRPDPPDLVMAYQAANVDVTGAAPTHALPMPPAVDLGQLEEIDLELAKVEPATPGAPEGKEPADAASDLMPTFDLMPAPEDEIPPVELNAGAASPQEVVVPPTLELSELGGITLELVDAEDASHLGDKSPERTQTPTQTPEVKQVYDLDLDEDLDGLTLAEVEESATETADGDDEETAEYTLEIEDELEVDELELEADDEAEEEDDNDR